MLINSFLTKREFRQNLLERVSAAKVAKHQTNTQKQCEHDFKSFKETIRPDTDFAYTAYFIVKGCTKCHYKIRIDYKII